jgi:hypothetical protein
VVGLGRRSRTVPGGDEDAEGMKDGRLAVRVRRGEMEGRTEGRWENCLLEVSVRFWDDMPSTSLTWSQCSIPLFQWSWQPSR